VAGIYRWPESIGGRNLYWPAYPDPARSPNGATHQHSFVHCTRLGEWVDEKACEAVVGHCRPSEHGLATPEGAASVAEEVAFLGKHFSMRRR